MSERFLPGKQGQPTFSRIGEDLYDEPSRQEKPTFSTPYANQEPLDAEIVSEETFGPSKSVEPHSGETREPGIHEATIVTDEGLVQLYEERAKEDSELEKAHQEKINRHEEEIEAKERARATTMGEAVTNFLLRPNRSSSSPNTSRLTDTTLETSQTQTTAEKPQIERYPQTSNAVKTALTFLKKYHTSRMRFERILKGSDSAQEVESLSKIRATLTEQYESALDAGQEFTPEMAVAFYKAKYEKNLRATGDQHDPSLFGRYNTVKDLFRDDPRALEAFMGLSAEEINNKEAA